MLRYPAVLRASSVLVAAMVATAGCASDTPDPQSTTSATLTKPPILVGFLNPSGGPVPQPGTDTGVKAALSYINGEFGGINGHPLEVVSCDTDTTPERAQSCANTFVEKKVVAVMDGYNLSSSAALPALTAAQIPLVGMIPFDSVTGSKAENRVFFAAPQASFLIGALQAFKAAGKTSVTLALVDTPSSHQTIDGLLPVLAKTLGINAKGIYFSPPTRTSPPWPPRSPRTSPTSAVWSPRRARRSARRWSRGCGSCSSRVRSSPRRAPTTSRAP